MEERCDGDVEWWSVFQAMWSYHLCQTLFHPNKHYLKTETLFGFQTLNHQVLLNLLIHWLNYHFHMLLITKVYVITPLTTLLHLNNYFVSRRFWFGFDPRKTVKELYPMLKRTQLDPFLAHWKVPLSQASWKSFFLLPRQSYDPRYYSFDNLQ